MTASEIIDKGILVYSSTDKDENLCNIALLKKACLVSYYTCHSLSSVDEVILGLLKAENNGSMPIATLGSILGFNVIDAPLEGNFYDEAEYNLFISLLDEVESWGLVRIIEDDVEISEIGLLSLSTNQKYRFYNQKTDYFDFLYLRNDSDTNIENYPFFSELGCVIDLSKGIRINYSDELVNDVISKPSSSLIDRIKLQTSTDNIISNVTDTGFLSPYKVSVAVKLYSYNNDLYLVFFHNDIPCTQLFELYEKESNKKEKEKKIEWALLYQILNDPHAILNYNNLGQFDDILEIDKLIPDKRLQWSDPKLLDLIIKNCTGDDWHNLSQFCDCDILKTLLDKYGDLLDWNELTVRMDESFISSTSKKYPWVKKVLFYRDSARTSLVCQFLEEYIFPEGKDDGVWEWDDVIPVVGLEFIKNHISSIPFNLYSLTGDLVESDWDLVSNYPEARWNWKYISDSFSLDFILGHFDALATHLNIEDVFERIFTDSKASEAFSTDTRVFNLLSQILGEKNILFSVNTKNYIWSDNVIQFMERLHLLSWLSGVYTSGFECNPFIQWNKDFFTKYHQRVETDKGYTHVSAFISDTTLVDDFPDFKWDYKSLSANKAVYENFDFVKSHRDKLDARVLLQNALTVISVEANPLYDLFDIKSLLESDTYLKTILTEKASVDYVRNNISYPWNWHILTKRLCQQLKIEIIGNEKWADKWDWEYLSKNLGIKDVLSYAVEYKHYWNWRFIIDRLESNAILEERTLKSLNQAFNGLEDHDELCSLVTRKFSKEELLELTCSNGRREDFDWDFSYLYSLPDFSAKDYLEQYLDDVKWKEFSRSDSVNDWFSKTGKGNTQTLWIQNYKGILVNEKYHWDFCGLSTLNNLIKQPHLFEVDKNWDWDYISVHAPWISFKPKKDYFLKKYQKYLSFKLISKREDVGLTEEAVIKYGKNESWDWEALTNNPSIVFSFKFINDNPDKPWNWVLLSERSDLRSDVITANLDKPWNWPALTEKEWFVPSLDIMKVASTYIGVESWNILSNNRKLSQAVVEKYPTFINWRILVSQNKAFDGMIKVNFLKRNQEFIPWKLFNDRIKDKVTTELVEEFYEQLDWFYVSRSQLLKFTTALVRKYEKYWYWSELCENLKVHQLIPDFDRIFSDRVHSAEFVNRLKRKRGKPFIYHFTHLFNAIDVIKSRKILSRDKALELGLLKFDSAGSVISRNTVAHKYARFYFRPCTPTQYYNEALGADSKLLLNNSNKKYRSAYNLGLPKCPVPVFFRFDLEEVLSVMGEKCSYSDRNMQSDCPQIYSVINSPEHLMIEYLYSTMDDALQAAKRYGFDRNILMMEQEKFKKYSQQEFLVDTEFDFSMLKNYEIICYDGHYEELLKSLIGEDPICEKISSSCGVKLFERENRSIDYGEFEEKTTITSDFQDEHYYLVKSQYLDKIRFDVDPKMVISETSQSIKLKGEVKWSTTMIPLQVFFIDPNARIKEWLIYENTTMQNNSLSISPLIINKLPGFVSQMDSMGIMLSKELFYPHMISSYHGIGHTARVVFYSYLLATGLSEITSNEIQAICIAATIHDLGKQSDTEGSIHGFNSMTLYKDKIAHVLPDTQLRERVLNAVRYHSIDDRECPEEVINDIITKILKDADALDRSRFGGRGCDRSYLRLDGLYNTAYGEAIFKVADILPALTNRCAWDNPIVELIDTIKQFK